MYKKIASTLCAFSLLGVLFAPSALADESADAAITKSVREGIRESFERPLNSDNITVFTEDGTVYLRGKVHQFDQISSAEGIAKSTPGVNKVVNELELMSDGNK